MSDKVASFRISDVQPVPVQNQPVMDDGLLSLFSRMVLEEARTKPSYAGCWILSPPEGMREIAYYRTPYCGVTIGDPMCGELEYDVMPLEYSYPDGMNAIIMGLLDRVRQEYRRNGGRLDRESVTECTRRMVIEEIPGIVEACGQETDVNQIVADVCSVVYRYSVGAGIFDILLTDPHIEDVYIDAPCDGNRIYVTLNGIEGVNSHMRCRTNLMVEKREVDNLINILRRTSGLRYCQSSPVLETDFPGFEARATVVGYPLSPKGDAVAIRKHSSTPWTLSRMIMNGTIGPKEAGMLSFLVANRCTFLICGPRGAGKSSLLSALMFEFPKEQRILTIEDTMELPGEAMRRLGYKVQTILVDDRMNGDQLSRSDEALRVSLRMGESAIILGEVRGEEARTLYQSMRAGRAGSSVMGTIHGDSAESVYQRVTGDMGVSPEAFMATDMVVVLGTVKDRRTGNLIRRVNEMKATGKDPGTFLDIANTEDLLSSPMMERSMRSSQLGRRDIAKEIRARALMRSVLAEAGGKDVRFLGPEWILQANDTLESSGRDLSAEEVCDRLRSRMGVQG